MRKMLKVLWTSLVYAYDGAFQIVLANLFWAFVVVAVVQISVFLTEGPLIIISILLMIGGVAAAFSGLYYATFQVASSEPVDWKTFFSGIRHYYWAGLRWTVINAVVLFSLIFYFFVLFERQELWAVALLGLDLGVMAFWILMQLITFPLMLMQEKPAFLQSLRNALVFFARWPGYTFTFLAPILVLFVAGLSFWPLFLFLVTGLMAYLGSYAVYFRIESDRRPELFADPRHEHQR